MEKVPIKPDASDKHEASTTVMPEFELATPLPPKTKGRRYLFALILSRPAVYFFLPRFAAMGHVLQLISTLRIPFVVLSLTAQPEHQRAKTYPQVGNLAISELEKATRWQPGQSGNPFGAKRD
jgi:hypothetical protein